MSFQKHMLESETED
jgi:pentatricopeptide repeat protein